MLVSIICTTFQLCVLFTYGTTQTAENFYVESVNWCPTPVDPVIKVFVTFVNSTINFQKINGNLSSPVDIGENQMFSAYIETKVVESQRQWLKLFQLKEDFCRGLKMYVGEFSNDLQRGAGIIPGTCPMRKGNYHVNNIELNFRKLKIQAFPFGKLRITVNLKDKSTSKKLACFVALVKNNPKK